MKTQYLPIILILIICTSCNLWGRDLISANDTILIDHNCTKISDVPVDFIQGAKEKLVVAYGHTSHGSQLITGMEELDNFMHLNGSKEGLYNFNSNGSEGALALRDMPFEDASDLGAPDFTAWAPSTRKYLEKNEAVNVVMWSWCGQVSWASNDDINNYLQLMTELETDFPKVKFVYFTGHLDGTGAEGTLTKNNNKIREYCKKNGKVLFDFADIESFDPDGTVNYMELYANDNCDYDSNNDSNQDKNWAIAWQESHEQNKDWYNCSVAHSQALNGNRKAYAAWWLFARLAGWQAPEIVVNGIYENRVAQNFHCAMQNGNCSFKLGQNAYINDIQVYSLSGQLLQTTSFKKEVFKGEEISIDLNALSQKINNNLLVLKMNCSTFNTTTKILFR